ncbi:hypothetical protein BGZ51_003901 [Haplosporangium sp. Z 767]|nr:hypothetical protein BGZ50_008103 [Haplosporangium sp. Z 11]KAF9183592.1 hypothetical protein BGZ51_003901 [Haplosporangium sp. Z 767]
MNYGQGGGGYPGQQQNPYGGGGYDPSIYPPQQQQQHDYSGNNVNSQGYDPSNQGYDPNTNYSGTNAPPYTAYPPSSNMLAGGPGAGVGMGAGPGGYPASPAFNNMHLNSTNSLNNGPGQGSNGMNMNNGYPSGSLGGMGGPSNNYDSNTNMNNNSINYGPPPSNQQYQASALNYQQTIYNPSAASHVAPGISPSSNNPPTPSQPARAQQPQPEGDYPVVMAIDFGTTFSGVAYALKADGEVHDMTKWPRHLAQYPKTPTLSLYKKDSQKILDWGHAARLAMLKPAAKDFTLLRKFKLQLDETLQSAPLENGITALEAVTHYLKKLHGHVMSELMKGFIKNYEPSQFQYCLTVPAMWSDAAKNTMRRAAIGAGLIQEGDPPNRLILISEPEAAAMYCERMVDRFSLKHGDRFMICDAGGGTVDLIVFEVNEPPGQTRHLREVTRGHGASCGSVFLDANMERLLERKFRRYRKGIKACGWASLMDTFVDMVKPMFNGQEDVLMQIPQATGLEDLNDPEIGLEEGVLCVPVEEMKAEVFEPVISDVLDLIQKQLHQSQQTCSAIFMVGGFGSSRYLEERVRQEFSHLVDLVAVPQRPELAVVRGAVYAGLNTKTINMRVARRWYGVDANMPFEEGVDPESKKIISHDGHVRCKERFSVYVRPGQQIGVDECVSKEYVTWSYPKGLDSPLYVCNSPTQPKYITDPGVQKIADFHIPMPEIPGAQPRTRVVFRLNMYFGLTEVRAEAVINGNTYTTICSFGGGGRK